MTSPYYEDDRRRLVEQLRKSQEEVAYLRHQMSAMQDNIGKIVERAIQNASQPIILQVPPERVKEIKERFGAKKQPKVRKLFNIPLYRDPHHYYLWVSMKLNVHDVWIGVFWKRRGRTLDVYVCLLPCLPLHVFYQDNRIVTPHDRQEQL